MKKLRHPNVVLVLGISIDDKENLVIILEYVEYGTLDKFVKSYRGEIPVPTKLDILFDIVKALNYFHSNSPKVIHRDMKPENIFISSDLKAKVGDFGMCLMTDSDYVQEPTNGENIAIPKKNCKKSFLLTKCSFF